MKEFHISERYKLEIHWQDVKYDTDIAFLSGCFLSGPVIKELAKLNEKDYIKLDFSNAYIVFVQDFYIVTFSWAGAKSVDGKIILDNVKIENKHLNSVPKLNSDDYIVVDTENHENEKHKQFMSYDAYLIRQDNERYNFAEE